MSALIKACAVANTVKNTGKSCDISMVAAAMIIAVPRSLTWNAADMLDFDAWVETHIHASATTRIFPLFGQNAPIRTITNDQQGDIMVELDDGLKIFLRYGLFNMTFETTSGGLCYAKALQSLNKSGYSTIIIDQEGKVLCRNNGDGTYSGLITDFMYSPSPVMPDFKSTPWKARFQITVSPVEIVTNGIIFEGATTILDIMGLLDAELTNSATTQTITTIFFGVKEECSEADLVALLTSAWAFVNNFSVYDVTASAAITPSAAAVVGGEIRLTGTFPTGHTIRVTGATPATWKTHNIEGYDGEASSITIAIP